LLGTRRDGELVYAGKVGTGFSEASLEQLHAKLKPLSVRTLSSKSRRACRRAPASPG